MKLFFILFLNLLFIPLFLINESIAHSLVNNNSSPKTIDAWDSMNMYVLINEVETEFGIKFSLDEILEIQNVQNIENLLVKHGCENK